MTDSPPVADGVVLDVDLRLEFLEDGIRGAVSRTGEEERSFTGWLGLLSALDGLRDVTPGDGSA
jgi:hypothetical protein